MAFQVKLWSLAVLFLPFYPAYQVGANLVRLDSGTNSAQTMAVEVDAAANSASSAAVGNANHLAADSVLKFNIAQTMAERRSSADDAVSFALGQIGAADCAGGNDPNKRCSAQLYFPGGTYTLNNKIEIRPHAGQPIAVYGDGPGITTLRFLSADGIDFESYTQEPFAHAQSPLILRDLAITKDNGDSQGAAVKVKRGVKSGQDYQLSGGQFSSYITNVHIDCFHGFNSRWHQGFHFSGGAVFMSNAMVLGGHFLDSLPQEGNAGMYIEAGPATSFRYQISNLYLARWRDGIRFNSISESQRIEGVYINNMEVVGVHTGIAIQGGGSVTGLQVSNSHIDFSYAGIRHAGNGNAVNWKILGNYMTQNSNGYNNKETRDALSGGVGIWVKNLLFRSQITSNTIECIRKPKAGDFAINIGRAESSFVQSNVFEGWLHKNAYGSPKCTKCEFQKE